MATSDNADWQQSFDHLLIALVRESIGVDVLMIRLFVAC